MVHSKLDYCNSVYYRRLIRVAQRVERWTCDQMVVGSNPILWAKLRNNLYASVTKQYNLVPATGGDALRPGR